MNVFQRLCTPFLEAVSHNRAFDIVVPAVVHNNLEDVLELEVDNEDDDVNQIRRVTRRFTDAKGCRSFAQIMAVAAMVLELKSANRTVSLRDVYYALKSLFKNQRECNACILEVGRILNLKRHEMNVVPAAKGFVSGPMRFRFHAPAVGAAAEEEDTSQSQPMDIDGNDQEGDAESAAQAHPHGSQHHMQVSQSAGRAGGPHNTVETNATTWVSAYETSPIVTAPDTVAHALDGTGIAAVAGGGGCCLISAQWMSTSTADIEIQWAAGVTPRFLVVVEKEGVFHRLVEERFTQRVNCILVTGCGYPDMATRALVSKISHKYPDMRVVGLCDYNPHGVALLLSYRFASAASEYESLGLQADVKWLGLRATHIREFLEKASTGTTNIITSTATTSASTSSASISGGSGVAGAAAASVAAFTREQLQELSTSDARKIRSLLAAISNNSYALPEEYEAELRDMLIGGVKCELECSYGFGLSYLPNLLERCLNNGDYI